MSKPYMAAPPETTSPPTETLNDTETALKRKRPDDPETQNGPNPVTQSGPDPDTQNGPDPETQNGPDPETLNGFDPETQNGTDPKSTGASGQHPLAKTSLCSYFRRGVAACRHGVGCRFAHSEEELRARPDGSWDPTSERVKKRARLAGEGEEEDEEDEEEGEEEGVMMTDILGEDDDPKLSKCLVHLPRKWDSDKLKEFLDEQGVSVKSAKKKKGMSVGFITFEAGDQAKTATEVLEGKTIGNNKRLKVGDVIPRSCDDKIKSAQKRYQTAQPGEVDETEASLDSVDDGSASKAKSARDAVTPLAHLPYTEQLEQKKNSLLQLLKRLTRNARKACPKGVPLPDWVVKSREIGGLPCKLEGIIESPVINGYRNKCEFSIGYSVEGKPTVGFMLGNFREGVTAVEEPINCPNVSKIACKYALVLQEFLQDSALPIWNRFNNTGFWRQLTVREGRKPQQNTELENESSISEVMVILQVSKAGYGNDVINSELDKLTQAFVKGAASTSPPLPLTTLVLQNHTDISNVAPANAPLCSLPITVTQTGSEAEVVKTVNETRIHDYIGGLRFSISPTAFFQVNTLAAEKLYSLAGDWAGLGPDTLLFDVCCGTGTIGLTLANRVGMVVGIEMNASAVSDAQRNAELNGITNCRFIAAKAETVMGSLLREYLDVPQQQDEVSSAPDCDDQQHETSNNENMSIDAEPALERCITEELMESEQDQQKTVMGDEAENRSTTKPRFKNVVAIVDPPRSGLHPVVLKALRTHPRLRRLVYISCNPETLVANAIELCTPLAEKMDKGGRNHGWRNMSNASLARQRLKSMPKSEPFQPVKAVAVDLFPHTKHCELVMLLER